MNGTPRLRSAFPATPRTDLRSRSSRASSNNNTSPSGTNSRPSPVTKPVQTATATAASQPKADDGPLIPLEVIDAPTQRLYVAAFYIGLLAWKVYDSFNALDDIDSTWLFLKWIGIDATFFVALPTLRVPWVEWSFAFTLVMWLLHAIADAFLMYRIPIPILGWLGAMVRVAYDRELAISEHRVKPADILHNSSIILGKQIIQILPEGSAILNPEKLSFCLDSSKSSVELPIRINQTTPISIELERYEIDTDEVENIIISGRQIKSLKKEADKGYSKSDTKTPRTLHYSVSKKGLYRLSRVVDETKLEVRRKSFDVAVVACPKAMVTLDQKDKCTGDLSGISLHVTGVPPFKVKYSKRINQQQSSSIEQSIQPSDQEQNVASDGTSNVVVDPKHPQRGWIQSRSVSVEINESLDQNGTWSYHVEEVEDGLGNRAMFDTDKIKKSSSEDHFRTLTVHRRPVAYLHDCHSQKPLQPAEGQSAKLPVRIKPAGQIPASDFPLTLKYTFSPDMAGVAPLEEEIYSMSNEGSELLVSKVGKYSLESVQSQFCPGEINEPSSCALSNPPRPDLVMDHVNHLDKCAGNPTGMTVNMDFTGTPPFRVRYTVTHRGQVSPDHKDFQGLRGQIEFTPKEAGEYTYQILNVADAVYGPVSLKSRNLVLQQDIRPPASADFIGSKSVIEACLGQPVSVPVRLHGEGPWDLEYEIVHGSKRNKMTTHSEVDTIDIMMPEMSDGGRYSVVLTAAKDKSGCRYPLAVERGIEVRTTRPSVGFGDINGHRSVKTLEGKSVNLPLRLQGIPPWTVKVQNVEHGTPAREYRLQDRNAVISETIAGTYELLSVGDNKCPGVVDQKANKFSIDWIQRPQLSVKDTGVEVLGNHAYRKAPVCQGYEDSLSLELKGNPPYRLTYTVQSEAVGEKQGFNTRPLSVASSNTNIKMETLKAGEYSYTFVELSDNRYDHQKKHFSQINIRQQVYALPTAKFAHAGKTYGYCKDSSNLNSESDSETIPITLTGTAPFTVEIAVTRHGGSQRPEIKRITDIPSNTFSWTVPRSGFDLGTHALHIRSVKDSNGCASTIERDPSSVRIHVSSPPAIVPLESTIDYCVGDRVSFSLSGQAPFDVYYTFQGRERKAHVTNHEFKRIAETPGDFIITGVSDAAMGGGGKCRARKDIQKVIHPYPSVRIERGQTKIDDIHEGGEVDIHFEFTGTPPFEFTYTRSENLSPKNKHRNKKPAVLETRHDTSDDFHKIVRATEEGTYEVVAIKDRYCAYSAALGASRSNGKTTGSGGRGGIGWKEQKALKDK